MKTAGGGGLCARKPRVQSRLHACVRLDHSHGVTHSSVGVLIVESAEAEGPNGGQIVKMRDHWSRDLSALECTDKSAAYDVLSSLPESVKQAAKSAAP